jgi:predicted RNA polymerase sigma factor
MIAEGLTLIDKAMRHRRPGVYQVQAAIAALHAQAKLPEDTDWAQIVQLYDRLERLQPSPIVSLNRAVAVAMADGVQPALAIIDALAGRRLRLHLCRHGGSAAPGRIEGEAAKAMCERQYRRRSGSYSCQIDRLIKDSASSDRTCGLKKSAPLSDRRRSKRMRAINAK